MFSGHYSSNTLFKVIRRNVLLYVWYCLSLKIQWMLTEFSFAWDVGRFSLHKKLISIVQEQVLVSLCNQKFCSGCMLDTRGKTYMLRFANDTEVVAELTTVLDETKTVINRRSKYEMKLKKQNKSFNNKQRWNLCKYQIGRYTTRECKKFTY